MFRRFVTFTIHKDNTMQVIETLSSLGEITVSRVKDTKAYCIIIGCDSNNLQACLDNLMFLSREGVVIRKLNVDFKV